MNPNNSLTNLLKPLTPAQIEAQSQPQSMPLLKSALPKVAKVKKPHHLKALLSGVPKAPKIAGMPKAPKQPTLPKQPKFSTKPYKY